MILPEKRAAVRPGQLDAVPRADFLAERRRNQPVLHFADVKVQQVIVRRAFHRKGRAVGAWRHPLELQLAILAGKIIERLRQFDVDAHHVGRERDDLRHFRRQRHRLGRGLDRDRQIGNDSGLTGMDHVVAAAVAAVHLAVDQAHAAGAADTGAAIMRKIDAVHQRPIEQKLAAVRQKRLVVDRDFANLGHLFHLDTNRPHVPRMSDLAVVEGGDPHEDATSDGHVKLACGVEPAFHLERPEAGGPAGRRSNVGAIA